jgi:hypothetical protein
MVVRSLHHRAASAGGFFVGPKAGGALRAEAVPVAR